MSDMWSRLLSGSHYFGLEQSRGQNFRLFSVSFLGIWCRCYFRIWRFGRYHWAADFTHSIFQHQLQLQIQSTPVTPSSRLPDVWRRSRHRTPGQERSPSTRPPQCLHAPRSDPLYHVKPCSQQTNWTELNWTVCSARTAALQPINFVTLTRATKNASRNWVNITQVSSVQFVCCEYGFTLQVAAVVARNRVAAAVVCNWRLLSSE